MTTATSRSATFKKTLGALVAAGVLAASGALIAAPAAAEPQNQERESAERQSVPGSSPGQAPGAAQARCLPREVVAERLGKRFGEARTAGGLASNGALMEVYSSKDGATWTVVMTMPQGISCIVAAGESWRVREQVALGPGA